LEAATHDRFKISHLYVFVALLGFEEIEERFRQEWTVVLEEYNAQRNR
jgi:hypothetical protein